MEEEKQQPIKNIIKKLHSVQADVEQMTKDGRNTYQEYNYLSETQITMKMKELFDKHGVMFMYSSYITGMTDIGKQKLVDVDIKYKFFDIESGEFIGGQVCGQGADTGDKGVYKAVTGAIKYLYMKTFNIPTGDDPEKTTKEETINVPETAPPPAEDDFIGDLEAEERANEGTVQNLADNQMKKVEGQVCPSCQKGTIKRSKANKLYCDKICWEKK